MQLIVYIALFIILSPRYFFSFAKTSSGRIGFKEVVSHAAVFGFAVVIMQWVSKRYGVFEGFTKGEAKGGAKAPPGGAKGVLGGVFGAPGAPKAAGPAVKV